MKKLLLILIVLTVSRYGLLAKEGMWIPMLLEKMNASEMQAMGMKITAEDIYSINKSSLKDAIVHFGGGCTAELVSSKGLLLTNHHCGYRNIQQHSSVEHDYLTDGFWAPTMKDELTNPGLTAKILTYMEDVSDDVLKGVTEDMTTRERDSVVYINSLIIKEKYKKSEFEKIDIKAFYYGNQYILMKYDIYKDVRLVGAPPSNIGKFGGDTDNWMWPRHTGDFSVFRIYANKDNKPANIADDNVPYKPKQHLKVSLKGVKEGDFTFIFGYPGRTQEYIPASSVKFITEVQNPFKIDIRRQKLDIMSEAMNKDKKIRIQYSAKYAGVSNGWKKWIGEDRGIKRLNTVANKQAKEAEFDIWANKMQNSYAGMIDDYNKINEELSPYEMAYSYFVECGYYHDLTRFANGYSPLVEKAEYKGIKDDDFNKSLESYKKSAKKFYKDYNETVDKKIFIASLTAYYSFPYDNIPKPPFYSTINGKYKGNVEAYVNYIYKKSVFANEEKFFNYIDKVNRKSILKLNKDPMYAYATSIFNYYREEIYPNLMLNTNKSDSIQRIYMKAILDYYRGDRIYPDANSTLRVSYGKVGGFYPKDAVKYNYFTTLKGIMEKENPDIYDYVVTPKLKELYNNKDYGKYADADGKMHVCFIASNHTTGGNSGSPALDANGNLIGINFDRNWEGTMSDLNYDPDQCRNIMLDIRYCLFIIDKFAGSKRLVDEMTFVE
jgi:hypothetical protein